MLKVLGILFTIVWVMAGYEVYEESDDILHKVITSMIVAIPIWFVWFR